MKTKLIIFGAGKISEAISYYFNRDSEYQIIAYVVDDLYVTKDNFLEKPLIKLSEVEDKYPDLQISHINMGYDEIAMAVNKDNTDLLITINISLASMKDNKLLPNICEKFFKGDNTKCIL